MSGPVAGDGSLTYDRGELELMAATHSGLVRKDSEPYKQAANLWSRIDEPSQAKLVVEMARKGHLSRDGYFENYVSRVVG